MAGVTCVNEEPARTPAAPFPRPASTPKGLFVIRSRTCLAVLTAALTLTGATAWPASASDGDRGRHDDRVVVIAHRGASGYRPEHTAGAYRLAIKQCADYIEPDLVTTKDGVLVDRHEPEISTTTNVADHPEFAGLKTTKRLDGNAVTGWFTEDFTLAQLRTLRAVERLPDLRPANTAYNGRYRIPTFEEVLKIAVTSRTCSGQRVGVIPEIKHSTFFAQQGFDLEPQVVRLLHRYGFDSKRDPAVIQSFEVSNLQRLNRLTQVRLVQLIDCQGGPYDQVANGTPISYADMVTASGLRAISRYADQVGLCKNLMIPRNADNTLGQPTSVIRDAHRAQPDRGGLDVPAREHLPAGRLPEQRRPSAARQPDRRDPGFLAGGDGPVLHRQP